ncbi:MAG: molybdopterin cofactor-binding domain-containing protein [Pseudomonadota bacterium]
MSNTVAVNRRQFVIGGAATGSGLALGLALNPSARATTSADAGYDEVNAWVVIDPNDQVTIRIARSEMGQGTLTGLAQMVVEELECDWDKVAWEFPTPGASHQRDRVWGSFSTGGSRGIRGSHQYVREGGAIARSMLIEAAAKQWGVKESECSVSNGVISHDKSKRATTYGAVAEAAAKLAPPLKVALKDPEVWTVIGQPVKRLDTREKLTGALTYGADIVLPGMLNAAIKDCPIVGGSIKSYDAKAIEGKPGVRKIVAVGESAVAVVADTWWQAKTALDALPIEWEKGPHADLNSAGIDAMLNEGLDADDAFVGNQNGNYGNAIAKAAKTVEARYSYPYQNHATMEPMNATAKWTPERCEVWCPTQNGEAAHAAASEAAGLSLAQCDVYKTILGGGFGRRGAADYVTQAVTIAKAMPGTPVKLLWTREEDMQHGMYHPITKAKITGGLTAEGELESLHVRLSGQSILAALNPGSLRDGMDPLQFQALLPNAASGPSADHVFIYRVPNLLIDHAMRNPPIQPGFWRGVNANQNVLYLESFMDELAHAAGKDPLEFRQKLLKTEPKALAVLNAVAEKSGWGTPLGEGRGRGLAVCKAFGSYVAACAEVTVSGDGSFTMDRIVAATDPGFAVNPQQIEAQVAGSFVYGLSGMLYEQVTWKDGQAEQTNFHNYPSMRIADMPEVETIVMPSGGGWGGVGEPTIAVAAPSVINAIFAASGKRLRDFPLGGTKLPTA